MRSLGILDKLDDALNPIVVKELRQAVKSRFIVAALFLFLSLQVIILAIFLVTSNLNRRADYVDFNAGRSMFLVLQGILLGTCMLFIPAYAGIRLAAERSDTNVDLLFISTLRPRAIIWGKLLAAVILVLMIFSACAPFMTFTYLLRGIDIPTILLVLAIDFLAVVAGIQLAIFIATIPGNLLLKILLGLIAVASLVGLSAIAMSGIYEWVEFGSRTPMDTWEFWGPALTLLVVILGVIGLVFCWSVAVVSPPSANRALPVRLYLFGLWVATAAIAATWSYKISVIIPVYIWMAAMIPLFSLELFIAINERDHWAARVARTIPRRWWLRVPAFLFYSGSAGGVLFAALIIGLTLLGPRGFEKAFPAKVGSGIGRTDMEPFMDTMKVICLYSFAYAMTAVLVRSMVLRRVQIVGTWVIAFFMVAILSTVPYLVAVLVLSNKMMRKDEHLWLIANPFQAALDREQHSNYLTFVSFWAGTVALLCLPWLIAQLRRFRPFASETIVASAENRSTPHARPLTHHSHA